MPSVLEKQLRQDSLQRIGRTEDVRSRSYAISIERKLKHPAVVAICDTARRQLFNSVDAPALEANGDQEELFSPVGRSQSKFRLVSCHMPQMLRVLSLHENQDGFGAAAHNGSSEEWHRRCREDE